MTPRNSWNLHRMGLLSIFKRKTDAKAGPEAAAASPGSVQQARARARQRLVGAVVLVVIGVIAFPLVFESQPRPIPVDIPIEIPRKDGAPALVMPPARPVSPVVEPGAAPARSASGEVTAESGAAGGREAAAAASAAAAAEPAPSGSAPKPAPAKPVVSEPVETSKKASASVQATAPPAAAMPAPLPTASADAARAKALLEGKAPAAGKEGGRFVVQVGAFAEASAAQDTRTKVEKLGLKTYTQVTETAAGNRIRVRLGPFASREEAERVLAKAKAAGVNGVVLTL